MLKHPIETLTVHEALRIQNLTIYPLTLSQSGGPAYLTSAEAMEGGAVLIKELNEGGSVPDLLVINTSDQCVLLLDGEELRGAKQNRIVNTTLLLASHSRVEIPVSCTEQGRWHYTSDHFSSGKTVMPSKARRRKTRAVSESLAAGLHFMPNQGEVWEDVEELHAKLGSQSPTSAMSDAYETMREELESASQKAPPMDGQNGLIALINGAPAGLDLVSRPGAYAQLHDRVLQSYAMEALVTPADNPGKGNAPEAAASGKPDILVAKAFLERCAAIAGKPYASKALGTDWRFVSPGIVGSGLEYENTWIHMAYFVDEESARQSGRSARMARMSRRSHWRRGDPDGDLTIY